MSIKKFITGKISKLINLAGSNIYIRKILRLPLSHLSLKDIKIKMKHDSIFINSIDRLMAAILWKYSFLSNFESKIYKNHITKGMTLLDIGANIGFFTMLFANLVGKTGKVFAFEPEPNNFRLLKKNIETNKYTNVVCVNKAVSAETSKGMLFISEEHRGDHRIFDSADNRKSIVVDTISIDDFITKGMTIDFIKMDIQGAEYLALQGMKKTLSKSHPLSIICEFSPSLLKKANTEPILLLKKFKELGFKIHYLDENKNRLVNSEPEEIIKICPANTYINLFLKKEIKQTNFAKKI